MNRFEFRRKLDAALQLIENGQFREACMITDKLDMEQLEDPNALQKISKAYEKCRRYEEAEEILLQAKDFAPRSRSVLYKLCLIAVKSGNPEDAESYFDSYLKVGSQDSKRFILRYRIAEARQSSYEERIRILEEYRAEDPEDKWMYELARIYAVSGRKEKAIAICDEIELWYDSGKYVEYTKLLHAELDDTYVPAEPEVVRITDPDHLNPSGSTGETVNAAETENESTESGIAGTEAETDTAYAQPVQATKKMEAVRETDRVIQPEEGETEKAGEEAASAGTEEQEHYTSSYERPTAKKISLFHVRKNKAQKAESSDEAEKEKAGKKEESEELTETAPEEMPEVWVLQKPADMSGEAEKVPAAEAEEPAELPEKAEEPAEEAPETPEEAEQPEAEEAPVIETEEPEEVSEETPELPEEAEQPETPEEAEQPEAEEVPVIETEESEEVIEEPAEEAAETSEEPEQPEVKENTAESSPEAQETPERFTQPEIIYEEAEEEEAASEPEDDGYVYTIEAAAFGRHTDETDDDFLPITEHDDTDIGNNTDEADEDIVPEVSGAPEIGSPVIEIQSVKPSAKEQKAEDADAEEESVVPEMPDLTFEFSDDAESFEVELKRRQKDSKQFGNLPVEPEMSNQIWHFMVFGNSDRESLEYAREIMKTIKDSGGSCPSQMLKISSSKIGNASIIKSLDLFLGRMVIIEQAGMLSDRQLREFTKVLDKDDRSLLVAFTDTRNNVIRMFERVPELAQSFTAVYEGKKLNARDLVNTALEYLYANGAKATRGAEGMIYEYARALLTQDKGFYKNDIRCYAEKALAHADKGGFFGLSGKKTDSDGYLVVTEKHFRKVDGK